MKFNRTYIFIALSSIALVVVLIIQVNWILETAQIKEELFNEKANIILARTTDALVSDKKTCEALGTCVGKDQIHQIDSLLNYYMAFYNFDINYSFEVVKPSTFRFKEINSSTANLSPAQPACYQEGLKEEVNKYGWELKLNFPEKKQFIIAEMGIQFATSVVLIIVVLILFWRTTLSLLREKKISEHTTDFLNNMTHEFKTPLTNIALASKMIIKDSNIKQEDKIKHYSGIILEENEKLRLQVEQVLSMTALERGEIPIQKTEIDIHQLIQDSVKCMHLQLENKQGSLNLKLNADRFVVMGDKTHLTNTICNLIDNAIKYSIEKPEISIQTSNSDSNLVMVVSDKGIGIEKEYQDKVFDKFFRVPSNNLHNVKGFGLGLAYIKTIIELHRGEIKLDSEKQIGTSFTITIPYV
ncbi:MAG: HAMP domain-containing histidine kinase [Bacteroidia bacterium]|nr:HAMP domain-containing histidine kinase [Bacteroidia bacterium]